MGDVGVEAQAFVVQFLLVFVALLLQLVQCFSIQSFLVGIEYREKDDKGQQDIELLCPPSKPKGWGDADVQ